MILDKIEGIHWEKISVPETEKKLTEMAHIIEGVYQAGYQDAIKTTNPN